MGEGNKYEEAAQNAVEAHPLPGEDLDTTYADDAEHWVRVYQELLDFKTALIDEMNSRLPQMSRAAVEEVERSDALVLQAEANRFRSRLAAWEQRRAELRAREGGRRRKGEAAG